MVLLLLTKYLCFDTSQHEIILFAYYQIRAKLFPMTNLFEAKWFWVQYLYLNARAPIEIHLWRTNISFCHIYIYNCIWRVLLHIYIHTYDGLYAYASQYFHRSVADTFFPMRQFRRDNFSRGFHQDGESELYFYSLQYLRQNRECS